ncbi:MAG: hypothetical protein CR981_02890 [Proteobacteria bacterium]|nr:MAG: hypothetical protein CR981_02890 [Pseudomonadota bacterium]PIE64984.1 MAG: hypothetical protein CSA26_05710 [Desulfobacterales bacterium]
MGCRHVFQLPGKCILVSVLSVLLFSGGCSGENQDDSPEKAVETIQQKGGRELAEGISRPIERAEAVGDLSEQRTAEFERQVD